MGLRRTPGDQYHRLSDSPATGMHLNQQAARRFDPSEPEAYRRDVPEAEVHVLDAGHFALDTAADEIAELVQRFMSNER